MHWIRFERGGQTGFGTLRDGVIQIHEGDMFAAPRTTSATGRVRDEAARPKSSVPRVAMMVIDGVRAASRLASASSSFCGSSSSSRRLIRSSISAWLGTGSISFLLGRVAGPSWEPEHKNPLK